MLENVEETGYYIYIRYSIGVLLMFLVGEKVIYGENGVCTVVSVGPLDLGSDSGRLYYTLAPLVGTGTYFAPTDTSVFMRPVMSREDAERFIDTIPSIEPAICTDSRFNHVDAFYRDLFKLHTNEALVSVIKGLRLRLEEKKTKSSRAEATMKRARDILHGELSIALEMDIKDVDAYIASRIGNIGSD